MQKFFYNFKNVQIFIFKFKVKQFRCSSKQKLITNKRQKERTQTRPAIPQKNTTLLFEKQLISI